MDFDGNRLLDSWLCFCTSGSQEEKRRSSGPLLHSFGRCCDSGLLNTNGVSTADCIFSQYCDWTYILTWGNAMKEKGYNITANFVDGTSEYYTDAVVTQYDKNADCFTVEHSNGTTLIIGGMLKTLDIEPSEEE